MRNGASPTRTSRARRRDAASFGSGWGMDAGLSYQYRLESYQIVSRGGRCAYLRGMIERVHTVEVTLDWALLAAVSKLDRFDASWSAIERREGQTLKQLKAIATVRSVGASTRVEGSRMSDAEVEVLLRNTDITKLEDRDSQEVVGYFQVLDLIAESYADSWHFGEQHQGAAQPGAPFQP